MAALLFFLGLSLAGQFEIGLTLTSAGGTLAAKQGYTGSFFTGVLAVIVATPCTAPFMGVALGYALSQTAIVTFAVFTALALGLAAPYLLSRCSPHGRASSRAPARGWRSSSRPSPFPSSAPSSGSPGSSPTPMEPRCLPLCSPASFSSRSRDGFWAAGPQSAGQLRLQELILLIVVATCDRRSRAVGKRKLGSESMPTTRTDMAALVRRSRHPLSIPGPPRLRRLHRELVPHLPGQRARRFRQPRSPESLCGYQRRPHARRLDPLRRRHHPHPQQLRPQRRSHLRPLRSRREPARASSPRSSPPEL